MCSPGLSICVRLFAALQHQSVDEWPWEAGPPLQAFLPALLTLQRTARLQSALAVTKTCGSPLNSSKLAKAVGREPWFPSYDNDSPLPTGRVVCIPNCSGPMWSTDQNFLPCSWWGFVVVLFCLFETRSLSLALAGWHIGRPRTQCVHQADLELRKLYLPPPPGWTWFRAELVTSLRQKHGQQICFEPWS